MKHSESEFEKSLKQGNAPLLKEFFQFAKSHKKLWLIPIFVILVMAGFLIILGGSSAAPFIYRLF